MCLGLFLSTVETSITATALVSIGHYFNNSIMVHLTPQTSASQYAGPDLCYADNMGRFRLLTLLYG